MFLPRRGLAEYSEGFPLRLVALGEVCGRRTPGGNGITNRRCLRMQHGRTCQEAGGGNGCPRALARQTMRIDAVAVPDTVVLTVLRVVRVALRTVRHGPLWRQAAVGRGDRSHHPEQGTKP